MSDAYSPSLLLIEPGVNDPSGINTWGGKWNTNAALIDSSITGIETLSVAGNSNVVLTSTQGAADQSRNVLFILTGALTGNIQVLWPQGLARHFRVFNNTTGAFTLTVGANNGSGTAAGTTYVVPGAATSALYSDGTNVGQQITDGSQLLGVAATLAGSTIPGSLTVAGNMTVGLSSTSNTLEIDGAASHNRILQFTTSGAKRFNVFVNSTVEGGSNAGSDLQIQNFTDAGSLIGNVLTITRSTGVVSFAYTPTFPTTALTDSSTNGATTALVQQKQIVSSPNSITFGGTGSFIAIGARANVHPTATTNYLVTGTVLQSFSGAGNTWGLEFLVDSTTTVGGFFTNIAQSTGTITAIISLTAGAHSIDLYWLGQNGVTTLQSATISAQQTN